MANFIEIQHIQDERGSLNIIEDQLGFPIKRVFYMYDVPENSTRGEHGHIATEMALIATSGKCIVEIHKDNKVREFILDHPKKCLYIPVKEWHLMKSFTNDCCLLVLASKEYDPNDYILEK
tara:strand:+ start:106005 stop:106367 length:363 start_codon:yes stop_codon:yes gene_type:complete